MNSTLRMKFALIAMAIVALLSLFVAYVTFRILQSSAEAQLQDWKLGGAFASFVFSASLLTSIAFQFYKQMTSEQAEALSRQVQELQMKVIKGAPRPDGYAIDVDEQHRLVFARPEDWRPRAGILYQYIDKQKPEGEQPNFNVSYQSLEEINEYLAACKQELFKPDHVDVEELYAFSLDDVVKTIPTTVGNYNKVDVSEEFIQVDGFKGLKYVHTYSCEFVLANGESRQLHLRQLGVFCYVPRLRALFMFTFTATDQGYLQSSEVFNNVISSIRFL